MADAYSRYLLGCQGLAHPTTALTRAVFERLFREYGLPERIRTDNGAPFATCALGRLSQLSAWWIRLRITPELIEPAHPEPEAVGPRDAELRASQLDCVRDALGRDAEDGEEDEQVDQGLKGVHRDLPRLWA